MKIQTLSIVVGSNACNARCPYCVSKLTGALRANTKSNIIKYRNLKKTLLLARQSGVTTVLLTGKGEPTLFPEEISLYLDYLEKFDFPLIELQTNGISLKDIPDQTLQDWYRAGLNTICLSAADYDSQGNEEIFGTDINLWENVERLHEIGFSVRISCVMVKDHIDSVKELLCFVNRCKEEGVEQFTARPVCNISFNSLKTDCPTQLSVYNWIENHSITEKSHLEMFNYIDTHGTKLLELAHGAVVWDYQGQNVSLSNCLTRSSNPDDMRQLIFFPDGHLKYDWEKEGAIIF